jgi:hypothetical protein
MEFFVLTKCLKKKKSMNEKLIFLQLVMSFDIRTFLLIFRIFVPT